jgi:hypothetical protein
MMDESRALTLVSLSQALPPGPECAQALSVFEPDVPWNADFLSFRLRCYQALGTVFAADAQADLRRFMKQNPPQFSL